MHTGLIDHSLGVALKALATLDTAAADTHIADAVEARHYPGLPPARVVPLGETIGTSVKFLGVVIGVNLLVLIPYLILLFISGPGVLLLAWAVNGYLLGREYFTLAAMRRIGRAGANAARKRHIMTIWAAGTLMAIPLTIPILNLVIPIIGAATFTHIFHALADKDPKMTPA